MSNQGWMVQAAALSYSIYSGSPDFGAVRRSSSAGRSADDAGSSGAGESRLELLKRIKTRINNGFYNTDAVIDDIGHGFAQALDQAL